MARRNADRAGVAGFIQFAVAALDKACVPSPPGLLVANPPYGRRLGDHRLALRGAQDLGRSLSAHYPGWRVGVLCPNPAFLQATAKGMRRNPEKTHALRNGGLSIHIAIWQP
jgi:23S rRNA G2445 N2-methylase RlmL